LDSRASPSTSYTCAKYITNCFEERQFLATLEFSICGNLSVVKTEFAHLKWDKPLTDRPLTDRPLTDRPLHTPTVKANVCLIRKMWLEASYGGCDAISEPLDA
jgi:hypothetical protein